MKRSGFNIMTRLIGLVKPLSGYMCLAITMGLIGHLCAALNVKYASIGCSFMYHTVSVPSEGT